MEPQINITRVILDVFENIRTRFAQVLNIFDQCQRYVFRSDIDAIVTGVDSAKAQI